MKIDWVLVLLIVSAILYAGLGIYAIYTNNIILQFVLGSLSLLIYGIGQTINFIERDL